MTAISLLITERAGLSVDRTRVAGVRYSKAGSVLDPAVRRDEGILERGRAVHGSRPLAWFLPPVGPFDRGASQTARRQPAGTPVRATAPARSNADASAATR
jgi:hypothetical protein